MLPFDSFYFIYQSYYTTIFTIICIIAIFVMEFYIFIYISNIIIVSKKIFINFNQYVAGLLGRILILVFLLIILKSFGFFLFLFSLNLANLLAQFSRNQLRQEGLYLNVKIINLGVTYQLNMLFLHLLYHC